MVLWCSLNCTASKNKRKKKKLHLCIDAKCFQCIKHWLQWSDYILELQIKALHVDRDFSHFFPLFSVSFFSVFFFFISSVFLSIFFQFPCVWIQEIESITQAQRFVWRSDFILLQFFSNFLLYLEKKKQNKTCTQRRAYAQQKHPNRDDAWRSLAII